MSTFIQSDYVVPAGETDGVTAAADSQGYLAVAFTFISVPTSRPSITVLGALSISGVAEQVIGIMDSAPAPQIVIGSGGSLSVRNDSGTAIAYENFALHQNNVASVASTIRNDGDVLAIGRDFAAGFQLFVGETLTNTSSGTIQAVSASGGATAVYGYGAATIDNAGLITASGTDGPGGAQTIGLLLGGGSSTLINSGHIYAGGALLGGGLPMAAIKTFGDLPNIITIDNSGLISASVGRAIDATSGGVIHLTNSGSMVGDLLLGIGPRADLNQPGAFDGAQIRNSGSIQGDIHLDTLGNDTYDGRGGTLTGVVYLGAGTDTVYLGDEGETVSSYPWMFGATFPKAIVTGGAGADTITGGLGVDTFDGGAGDDVLDGGTYIVPPGPPGQPVAYGVNTVSFASAASGVTVSLALQGSAQDTGYGHKTLSNFQNLTGSSHADVLTGDVHDNVIDGGGGDDRLTGGAGADTFVFRVGSGADEVTDFSAAQGDKIDLTAVGNVHTLAQVQALASQSGADTVVHFGGGGSLTLKNVALNSLAASDFAFNIAAGDFLGTGHASLYWQNSVNNLTSAWLLTDAAPASGVSLPAVSGWQTYDVGNFEGGAYGGDFLLRNTSSGMVDIWQDNAGTMSGHDVAKATLDWQIMGTADFNADGKSDILWRNQQNGYVSVWQMDGSTVSTTYNPGVVGLQWKLVAANDFYGDGKAEVLWRDPGSGEVNLWTIDGPGAGQTHGQTVAHLGAEWKVAGTGDFNGDGRADILWFDTVTGQVVLWEMNGPTVTAAQPIGDPGPQWRVVNVADISGDGKADILWRDTGTGQVVAWAMNGFNVDHYGVLATVDNTWKVINHNYDWA